MMMTQVISPVTSDVSDDDSDVFDDCSEEAVDCATVLRTGQYLCLDLDIDPDTQQVTDYSLVVFGFWLGLGAQRCENVWALLTNLKAKEHIPESWYFFHKFLPQLRGCQLVDGEARALQRCTAIGQDIIILTSVRGFNKIVYI